MQKSAKLSDDKKYRYSLTREWDKGASVLFIMLNPSTADADVDDPTIRKCIKYAKKWGFGSLYVGNLYAFRATKPKDVLSLSLQEATGDLNDQHLQYMINKCSKIVVAWGAHGMMGTFQVRRLIENKKKWCLHINQHGSPKHPLYCKDDAELVEWDY